MIYLPLQAGKIQLAENFKIAPGFQPFFLLDLWVAKLQYQVPMVSQK